MEENIKIFLRECERTDLAQDRKKWRALTNTVRNLRVPKCTGNFLTNWEHVISFSRTAVLQGDLPAILYSLGRQMAQSLQCLGSAVDDPGLNPGNWKRLLSSPKCPDRLWGPPNLLVNGYRGSFPGKIDREVQLTTYLYLVPRLRISGSIPLPHLYVFMAQTGKLLPLAEVLGINMSVMTGIC
jgi:hypothetical protein